MLRAIELVDGPEKIVYLMLYLIDNNFKWKEVYFLYVTSKTAGLPRKPRI